ncbi:MAG: penicillin-binding protein 2 [Pseudomonadales bacterium]|nr:penicillin-binding protein 2 [Pseudomonadales bacterium]
MTVTGAVRKGASSKAPLPWRYRFVVIGMTAMLLTMWSRAAYLALWDHDFLQRQGDQRSVHWETVPASRGIIRDRNGVPLAVSTPMTSLWVNPRRLDQDADSVVQLARVTGVDAADLQHRLQKNTNREFMYVRRDLDPAMATQILDEDIPGLYGQTEYMRFYPEGEPLAQLIGFTNLDGKGEDGLELAYDPWLAGQPGKRRVMTDLHGRLIRDVALLKAAQPGHDLYLSIDSRAQYLVYKELADQVMAQDARAGMAVALDVNTGEVLAMANVPSYNPNNRQHLTMDALRNRAVVDMFEPGSTMKPFTIAAALESGQFTPRSMFDTSPGSFRVGHHVIHDDENNGVIDLGTIITKSSNIGASKIALALPSTTLPDMFRRMGFGASTGSGFPGESPGRLPAPSLWKPIGLAHMSFGYGETVTALQLARAYAALASGGILKPISFIKQQNSQPGIRVLDGRWVSEIIPMLETVVSAQGTAQQASVPGYLIAGKTGTAHKVVNGSYSPNQYMSLFVGMAPASHPRIVMAVVIDTPRKSTYYGGLVSAPVFSRAMSELLRLMNVAPDHSSEHLAASAPVARGAG